MTYTNKIVNGISVLLTQQEIDDLLARDAEEAAKPVQRGLTPTEKLARIGLTVQELKDLLR